MLNHVTTVVNGSRKNWGCTEGRRRYIQLRFVHVVVWIFPSAGGEVGDGYDGIVVGWSANLPLLDYGRFARRAGGISATVNG